MNWKIKATMHWAFSALPFGESAHFAAQRFLSRSLPTPRDKLLLVADRAQKHLELLRANHQLDPAQGAFYEFGAGWDLAGPLLFYSYGARTQIVIDISRLVRPTLVTRIAGMLRSMKGDLGLERVPPSLPNSEWHLFNVLNDACGIVYLAPRDARATGLESASVDFITSTNTLEHIPRRDIALILEECWRILRPDGVVSFRTDYKDHYAYFDSNISEYNFLKYSEERWNWFNPSSHYQNRLRHADYIDLFEGAGFDVVEEESTLATPEDLVLLRDIDLHDRYRSMKTEDLGKKDSFVVLRKRATTEET